MKMLIAGEQVDSESGETTQVRNPATGEVVDSVPKGTITDIRRAIAGRFRRCNPEVDSRTASSRLPSGA